MGKDQIVEHDGLRFRCRLDGRDGAPWVMFSNSLMTDLTVWDAQVAALAANWRILRYDQRGHGGTSVPPGPADFTQLSGDALAIMDHFGVGSCAWVGLSMGVTTGLAIVGRAPRRLSRLVLSDGQCATAPGGREAWQARIEEADRLGMTAYADATIERWFSPAFRAAGGHEAARAVAAAIPLAGFTACARALQDYDFRSVLPAIAVPTLLMAGAEDGNMPNSMRDMAAVIPGARFQVIPDSGHIPCVEQAATFTAHLEAFLAA